MPKRYIILSPIGRNVGNGVVSLGEESITVNLSGTNDELRLFFLSSAFSGEESKIDAGTIKGGIAKSFKLKNEDIRKIDTVVLIKGSEPVIYGSLAPIMPSLTNVIKKTEIKTEDKADKLFPLGYSDGFSWLKIEDGRFAENIPIVRHVFENINVIAKINSLGYYYYGTKDKKSVVAIPSSKEEKNPFTHISDCARFLGGCWTVGIDKKERYFYSLIE